MNIENGKFIGVSQIGGIAEPATSTAVPRHFLMLQGLPGPSFRLLGKRLRSEGHLVSRINFNGGDIWDWRSLNGYNYRGKPDDFAAWLSAFLDQHKISDIILFGDNRPLHRSAIEIARERGMAALVFEEGMLRPSHVSLEPGGTNHSSPLPRNMKALRLLADQYVKVDDDLPIRSSVLRRTLESTLYYVTQTLLKPFFPHYKSHRKHHAGREMLAWIKRYGMRKKEKRRSDQEIAKLGGRPFILFPMQIDGDFQISVHSDYADMSEAIDEMFDNFAKNAPSGLSLLLKMHPFDPDIDGWRNIVTAMAEQQGISDRVFFVERHDLEPLLKTAKGVVTVNSTVGPLALGAGCPVYCLGRAIYDINGITAPGSLDQFWQDQSPVKAENFDIFCRALKHSGLVNGGFHDDDALALLVDGATQRILELAGQAGFATSCLKAGKCDGE